MTDETVQLIEVLDGVSTLELETLLTCLELPPLAARMTSELAGRDAGDQAVLIAAALGRLAERGYVTNDEPGQFTVRPAIAELLAAAAWPSSVLRLLEFQGGEPSALVFVYGIEGLSIVHEVSAEAVHRLVPKRPVDVATEVGSLLASQVGATTSAAAAFRTSRAALMADGTTDPDAWTDIAQSVAEARGAMLSGIGVRLDAAQAGRARERDLYLEVVGGAQTTQWLLTGVGLADDDLITCRPATAEHVHRALTAMLADSAFPTDANDGSQPLTTSPAPPS